MNVIMPSRRGLPTLLSPPQTVIPSSTRRLPPAKYDKYIWRHLTRRGAPLTGNPFTASPVLRDECAKHLAARCMSAGRPGPAPNTSVANTHWGEGLHSSSSDTGSALDGFPPRRVGSTSGDNLLQVLHFTWTNKYIITHSKRNQLMEWTDLNAPLVRLPTILEGYGLPNSPRELFYVDLAARREILRPRGPETTDTRIVSKK